MSVLVYTENWDGKFKKSSFELVSYAAGIAEILKTSLIAVSIGKVEDNELKKLGDYGADKILKAEDDKLKCTVAVTLRIYLPRFCRTFYD